MPLLTDCTAAQQYFQAVLSTSRRHHATGSTTSCALMWVGQLSLRLAPGTGARRLHIVSNSASSSSGSTPSDASNALPPPPPALQPAAVARTTAQAPLQQQAAPWSLSNYYTKKLARQMDSLGNIVSSAETVAASPGWTADAQLRLAAEVLSAELQQDASELLHQASKFTCHVEMAAGWRCRGLLSICSVRPTWLGHSCMASWAVALACLQ